MTAFPLAQRLQWALNRQARQMATDSRNIQLRVAEALHVILLEEDILSELDRSHPEITRDYTDNFFSTHPTELTEDIILSTLSINEEETARNNFEHLYYIQEAISRHSEVL